MSIASSRRRMNSTSTCRGCWPRCAPKAIAAIAWPAALGGLFAKNGLSVAIIAALAVAGFVIGMVGWHDPAALFATDGQFYRLMPHNAMAWLFGALGIYAALALADEPAQFHPGVRRGRRDGLDAGQPRQCHAALSRWRGRRLLQRGRAADGPAATVPPSHLLRLSALLRSDLRGDVIPLPARPSRALWLGLAAEAVWASPAASGLSSAPPG